jgi:hypothetical protein
MTLRTITVSLPDSLYKRAEETAEASALSLEQVIEQSLASTLPPLEDDLPPDIRTALSALTFMDDEELWLIAREELDEAKQARLGLLTEAHEERDLTDGEEAELVALFDEGDLIMLKKAESYRLLTRRGHIIPWINR